MIIDLSLLLWRFMRRFSFARWTIIAAVSTGACIYTATEANAVDAAVIGGLAVFGVLGAFREIAHEIADRLAPPQRPKPGADATIITFPQN
jgi:hypothetical protein